MLKLLFRRRQSHDGAQWVSVIHDGAVVRATQVAYTADARPRVDWVWEHEADSLRSGLRALNAAKRLKGSSLIGLLDRAQYRMQTGDAPQDVERPDWPEAMRWQLKDQVDFPVEDAVLDVLEVPQNTQLRQNSVLMAFLVPREDYTGIELSADDLGLNWTELDVPDTALRNISALCEEDEKAHALMVFGESHGMLIITYQRQLLMARHIEVTTSAITGEDEGRGAALSRAALEILRTVDTFERVHSQVNLSFMTVALPPGCTPDVLEMLSELIYVPLRVLEVSKWFDLDRLGADAERLNTHATFGELCALGAALRSHPDLAANHHLRLIDPNSVLGQPQPWGAVLAVRLAGGVMAIGTAAGVGLSAAATAYNVKAGQVEAEVTQLRIADAATPASPVVKQLEDLRQKDAQQRQMQDALQGSMAWSSQGYSDYLMALGRQTHPSVWVTGLSLHGDGRDLVLIGRTNNASALPQYLQRLGQEEQFKGRKFAQIEMGSVTSERLIDGVVQFVLRSQLIAERKDRGDNATSETTLRKTSSLTGSQAGGAPTK